jgi:hypothetical protein
MDAFRTAYQAWRERPFPPGSPDDDVDELHADLALADSWVAESVIPYIEDGSHQPANVDVLSELRALRRRAEKLETTAKPEESRLAVDYRDYIDALAEVYTRFLAVE